MTGGDLEVWAWNREHLVFLTGHLSGERTRDDVYAWFATYIPGAWQRKPVRVVEVIRDRLLAGKP